MYGRDEFYENVEVTKDKVQCPIKGCQTIVDRKKRGDNLTSCDIICKKHDIELRASTFIYKNEKDNLLWYDSDDKELLDAIKKEKRESRMENNNSEDALTWNVFRFLERNNLLPDIVELITGEREAATDLIYWSYSTKNKEDGQWGLLKNAQYEFGEMKGRGSEPDMAIETEDSIILIEAKFTSGNTTKPSKPEKSNKFYTEGANHWFNKVFKVGFNEIAVQRKRYELTRFWLLGSWMAKKENKNFYLVNLVLDASTEKLGKTFIPYVILQEQEPHKRVVSKLTWEKIRDEVIQNANGSEKVKMLEYFKNLTKGFSASGKVLPAFKNPV